MSEKELADKYIERGGYVHGEREDRTVEDMLCLGSFVGWHEDNHLQGGYRAREAWAAMCRLFDLHPVEFRKIIRGDSPSHTREEQKP